MKRTAKAILSFLLGMYVLSSCEDVPAPYPTPSNDGDDPIENEILPQGDGTAANPYNVVALKDFIDSGEYEGKEVYFGGIVTSFKSGEEPGNQYGNSTFYISDDGTTANTFYCYRIKNFNNQKFTSADQLAEGDTVVIRSKVTLYNGSVYETEQNSGYLVSRNGATSGDDKPDTPDEAAKGSGTQADPYNVAAANGIAAGLQKSSTSATYFSDEVYVKGKISQIDNVDTSYGNAVYYISDDGTTTGQLEVYRGLFLGGEKFSSEDQIKVGDEVVVFGKLQNWLGTYEFTSGSKIVALNGKTSGDTPDKPDNPVGEAKGSGTQADPYNVAAVLGLYESGNIPTNEVYVAGTISQIRSIDVSKYTRAQYYISDDGTTNNQFYVYNGLYLQGANFTANDQIKVGDKAVVCGTLTSYNGTNEFAQNNFLYSLNGKTEAEDSGDDDDDDTGNTGDTEGISVKGTTVTLVNGNVKASSLTETMDLSTFGFTNAQDVEKVTRDDLGFTVTFGSGANTTNAPKFYTATNGVRMYANNEVSFAGKTKAIAKVVLQCDSYSGTDYVGNSGKTMSVDGNSITLVNYYEQKSGGVQLRIKTIEVTYAE